MNETNRRLISINQEAALTFPVETVRLHLNMQVFNDNYDITLQNAMIQNHKAMELLDQHGIPVEQIHTADFGVEARYEIEKEDNQYRSIQKGFMGHMDVQVDMDFDTKALSALIEAVKPLEASIRLDYGLTNIEEKKNKVLELAINKAKEKAAFLAKASGVELGEIHSLEYLLVTSFCVRPVITEQRSKPSTFVPNPKKLTKSLISAGKSSKPNTNKKSAE